MAWDPDIYNQFKDKREEPFHDLLSHLDFRPDLKIIDFGCGTGRLTYLMAEKFYDSMIVGIDSSPEMLSRAPQHERLLFHLRSISDQLRRNDKWDLIVANASLQWIADHKTLVPQIISKLLPGGQLAVQIPSQKENVVNKLLHQLVHEPPFYEVLKQIIHYPPQLSLDDYTKLLFVNGATDAIVYQKVYPIIATRTETLYDFILGTSLAPYLERMQGVMKTEFNDEFKKRLDEHFDAAPIVYAFKRIILVASF